MNRTWAVVLVAACGSATPPAKPVVATATPAAVPVAVIAHGATMVGHPDTRAKIESPHGAPIAAVAETPDGTAAITSDELGGMRLWPALDGTREPCVVDLSPPRDLAIARHRDGFLVATIDAARGLALTVVDDQGRTLRHAAVSSDAGFIGMEMTDLGLLAWNDDQAISLFGFEGELLGRIGTEPGQRLANVAARGPFAAAEVDVMSGSDSPPTRIVRPLALEPKLAWGKAIDVGGDPMGALAISRTGKRLAVAVGFLGDKKSQAIRVIEPQTGRTIATQYIDMSVEFGFSDDNHLAAAVGNGVTWIDLTKKSQLPTLGSMATPKSMFATGDAAALTALGGELLVATPDDPKYLGYQLESPQVATNGPNGNLVIGVGIEFAQIDSALALVTAPTPTFPANSRVSELQWIGGDDYVANVANADGSTEVMIVASDGRAPVALRAAPSVSRSVRPLHYEPSTHLLTVSFGDSPTVDRWIPAQRRIEKIAAVTRKGFQQRELLPIAPALSGGAEIVDVSLDEGTSVGWMDAAMKKRFATMAIASFVTADAAGHVYAWMIDAATSQLVLSVLAPGKQIATLPHEGTVTLWPDAKGTRVLELGATGAALYRIDGTLLWKLPMLGASEAVWSGDNAISIITASGVARLEAATGAVTATRCGWRFGLTAESHPQPARLEPVCTQLRH